MDLTRKMSVTIGICLCIAGTAQATQVALQTSFVAPGTTPGTYSVGSSVGSPDSFLVSASPVTVVSAPCVAAGGVSQCLQLTQSSSAVPDLTSNTSLGAGTYNVTFLLAGGSAATTIDLTVTGVLSLTDQVAANSPFAPFQILSVVIPAGTSSSLEITGGADALVEGVLVTQLGTTTTPEPAALGLVTFGLLMVWPLRRLVQRAATFTIE